MSKEKKVVGISDFGNGMFDERFHEELEKVLENIADDDTPWKAVREINVKVRIAPVSDRRDKVASSVTVSSKIAQAPATMGEMAITATDKGISLLSPAEGKQLDLMGRMEEDKKVIEEQNERE